MCTVLPPPGVNPNAFNKYINKAKWKKKVEKKGRDKSRTQHEEYEEE